MFDITWIRDDLAVGGALPAGDLSSLASDHGVRHVVDVRSDGGDEPERLRRHGIKSLSLPTPDFGVMPPEVLDKGVRWIKAARQNGQPVLVHCQLGIGRSVLIVLCVLVSEGLRATDAVRTVKDRRPHANPSLEQLEALLEYEERTRGVPSEFDEVVRLAKRHRPGRTSAR